MTTVIQTQSQSQSKKVGAVKDIYTQLGMPTVSLFADAYQDVEDGDAINRILAYDGLDLIATSGALTFVNLKKLDGKNYLNFSGTASIDPLGKKAFNTDNNLTVVLNVKLISGAIGNPNRVFSLGATASDRVILYPATGGLLRLATDSGLSHVFDASNGFKVDEFNKIAVHFNKTKTIVVCNGVETEYPPYVINFGASFAAHRGTIEKDLDFFQIFEDTQVHTASKLIAYLDYISN